MSRAPAEPALGRIPDPPEGAVVAVDFDGTLIRGDSLWESLLPALGAGPAAAFGLLRALARGKAAFKQAVAELAVPDPETFAWRDELVERLRAWKASGRRLVLATASHRAVAEAANARLGGLFDDVLATETGRNLRGEAKAEALKALAGGAPVYYVGDSAADLPVWKAFGTGAVLSGNASLVRRAREAGAEPVEEKRPSALRVWAKALRVHQWSKNLLLFVPIALAHRFGDVSALLRLVPAFAAFCLCCSSVYLFNDLVDVRSDRRHPVKRRRPLASGLLSVPAALLALPLLLAGVVLCAAAVGGSGFSAVLSLYLLLTFVYSMAAKRLLLVDVLLLAGLYTLRLVAGAEASATPISFWLLVFSMFAFVSLAMLKRFVDLKELQTLGLERSAGRAYRVDDMPAIRGAGLASGFLSALVLALYVQSAQFGALYGNPEFFWTIIVAFLYWILRMWILAGRGDMEEDPVLFAVRDRASWGVGVFVAAMALLAQSTPAIPWLAERLWR